jgi:hypothetical protein
MPTKRILRVLEYVGPAEWIDHCISNRQVKGTHTLSSNCFIREAILGETSELLPELPQPKEPA